jgi:hypothetical protein
MDSRTPPAVADRITIALIAKAAEDLQALQDRTGLNKTDIVNRAIILYEWADAQLTGSDLLVRDRETRDTQLVRLL